MPLLNVADGTVMGPCQTRHRHIQWPKFLRLLDDLTPAYRDLHLILDNYATHKHPKVKAWLAKPPRFHLHSTPTSASWLNMIERFFRELPPNVYAGVSFEALVPNVDLHKSSISSSRSR